MEVVSRLVDLLVCDQMLLVQLRTDVRRQDPGLGHRSGMSPDSTKPAHPGDPPAIADFYLERVGPIVEVEGEPSNKPQRHGEPLAFYLR